MRKFSLLKPLVILFAVLIIVGGAYAGWQFWQETKKVNFQTTQDSQDGKETPKDGLTASTTELKKDKTSEIDASDWKVYQNEVYGYEIKYPSEWSYEISKTGFVEFHDDGKKYYYEGSELYLIGISVKDIINSFSLEGWISLKNQRGGRVVNVKIDNINAVQGEDYLAKTVIIDFKNKRYMITKPNIDSEEIDYIFNGILNSFKFIKA